MQTAAAANKKVQHAWAMYDWANSAYNLVITSTIFPAFYEAVTGDGNEKTVDYVRLGRFEFINTALYNYTLAVAFLIVAFISPLLASIADARGSKKKMLAFFAIMGSLACMGLFFFDASTLLLGLVLMIVACVGYWGSVVFYNSYLPEIALPEERDKLSAKGFAYGYVGSVILQLICFAFVLFPDFFGIGDSRAAQLSFLLTGIWWLGFSQIPLRRLPPGRPARTAIPGKAAIWQGYQELGKVWRQLKQIPALKRYIAAFFFFNMGVQTVMLAATLYGKSELGIPTENLIVAILIIQLVAIAGAWLIARLSGRIGNLSTLMLCVFVWIGICIAGYLIPARNPMAFYALAAVVGFVMGGIQSLARSTYSKLMPPTPDTTSFFSFYDVSEKLSIVIGMFSFGMIQELTGSQRNAVLGLMVFFVLGLILLRYTQKAVIKLQLKQIPGS